MDGLGAATPDEVDVELLVEGWEGVEEVLAIMSHNPAAPKRKSTTHFRFLLSLGSLWVAW